MPPRATRKKNRGKEKATPAAEEGLENFGADLVLDEESGKGLPVRNEYVSAWGGISDGGTEG
jgi:hypothetical protein